MGIVPDTRYFRLVELADCAATRQYIADLQALAEDVAVRAGGSEDDAAALPIPFDYAGWDGPSTFPKSMRFLYQHLKKSSE